MAKRNSITAVQDFCSILSEQIVLRYGSYPTIKDLVYHLSEKGIIRPIVIRNYLIVDSFYKQLKINEGHITHTVMDMSIEYDLSERQIQTIIYEYQKKFQPKNNLFR